MPHLGSEDKIYNIVEIFKVTEAQLEMSFPAISGNSNKASRYQVAAILTAAIVSTTGIVIPEQLNPPHI